MLKKYYNKLKEWCTYKIDDIKWDIVDLYMHTWLWTKIGFPAYMFNKELDNMICKEDAIRLISKKRFKYVPKSYKIKMVNEKFK